MKLSNLTQVISAGLLLPLIFISVHAENGDYDLESDVTVYEDEMQAPESMEMMEAKDNVDDLDAFVSRPAQANRFPKRSTQAGSRAEAFVAGPNWEFDGFVSGGQDMEIKSMFAVHDLLYLNIGYLDGFDAGDRIGIYRRGQRIRDPQTGRALGYEVKKVAISVITDRIDEVASSARVLQSFESVEIGDLVRRED